MNVYLIKTPEYESEKFTNVVNLLQSNKGPLNFIPSQYEFSKEEFYFLRYQLYPKHPFRILSESHKIPYDVKRPAPLSWRELFSLCSTYRTRFNIKTTDFVVLLTMRKNALNWFTSGNEERNMFVHTADWNLFTEVDEKYPIAHTVISTIMQILMKLDIHEVPNQFLHEPSKGCMNDFCQNKTQMVIKMQTANICKDCYQKIKEENIDEAILSQILNIFNHIRNKFIFQLPKTKSSPLPIIVEGNGRIILAMNDVEIKMTPLFKTLYIFYLNQEQGVSLRELGNYKDQFLKIYTAIRPSVSLEEAEKRIDNLIHPLGDSFNSVRAHVNRIIKMTVPESISQFYQITGNRGNPYRIEVPRRLIDIRI